MVGGSSRLQQQSRPSQAALPWGPTLKRSRTAASREKGLEGEVKFLLQLGRGRAVAHVRPLCGADPAGGGRALAVPHTW